MLFLLAAGLLCSQVVFTIILYLHNLAWHDRLLALDTAGYMIVPGRLIYEGMLNLKPAVCGAIFFTLSFGAFISLSAALLIRLSDFLHLGTKSRMIFFVLFLSAVLILLNINGWNPYASCAVIVIFMFMTAISRPTPCTTDESAICNKNSIKETGVGTVSHTYCKFNPSIPIHFVAVAIIIACWAPHADRDLFVDVRDHLLLGSAPGRLVNDFYYKYTLYPAEVFKTYNQKLICAYRPENGEVSRRLKSLLERYDYLEIKPGDPVLPDIYITESKESIIFKDPVSGKILKVPGKEFILRPNELLKLVSARLDKNRIFRVFTFAGLVFALPVCLYIFLYSFFRKLFSMFGFPGAAVLGVICTTGLFLAPLTAMGPAFNPEKTGIAKIKSLAANKDCHMIRNALMAASRSGVDPLELGDYRRFMKSTCAPVRYWFAQALAAGKKAKAKEILLYLTRDPCINVACQAYYSMGRSRNKEYIPFILSRIKSIQHPYLQWYAYKALKHLGWHQRNSATSLLRLLPPSYSS